MQSIITKYHGPGNVRGARVSAQATGGIRRSWAWDHANSADNNHMAAAIALASELDWDGCWHGGAYNDKGAQVWVREWHNSRESFTVGPKPARYFQDEALRVLAAIATTETNSNSEPDEMGFALDDAVSDAQAFFRLNNLNLSDYLGPVKCQHRDTGRGVCADCEAAL